MLVDCFGLTDEQRRLLVACGAGAGMAAAYNVPLGGALFALEVLRGVLALHLVLPAVTASPIMVARIAIPIASTYDLPEFHTSAAVLCWAMIAGPITGLVSVGYIRAIEEADCLRPKGPWRVVSPTLVFHSRRASLRFPELPGNGKDLAQLTFRGRVGPAAILTPLVLNLLPPHCAWAAALPADYSRRP